MIAELPKDRTETRYRSRRILLVDDDAEIRDSLSSLLIDEGYEVSTSDDGRGALDLLRVRPADLIILDLRMPVMDGWQFRNIQRADPVLAEIPVIAVSADGSAQAAAIHADHYLRKPFKADELLLAVERILLGRDRQLLSQKLRDAERIALLGTIAAGVGHEINNPLTYVLGNLEALRSTVTTLADERAEGRAAVVAEAEALLGDVRAGAERIREVVGSLRWLSRPRVENHHPVDLIHVLETSIAIAMTEIRHRARLERHLEHVPSVFGDEARLGQVFVNLLVNAAQAIAPGAAEANRVVVSTKLQGEFVAIAVSDTGSGIPAELQAKIFDPFFTTKDASTGTGLGLAITQNIVEEHGGRIKVESTPGAGSTFRVLLPLTRPDELVVPVTPPPREEPRPARLRLLVIDDDTLVLSSITRMLAREHAVTAVGTGGAGLSHILAGRTYDAILCDLMMPDVTGMDFHAEVARRDPELASRIVFMTGGAFAPEAREFLRQVNPAGCLEKPFTLTALRAALLAVTRPR
jgi:signal transduction histidine kinase